MRYFYDKKGHYIGGNNVGEWVKGAAGSTSKPILSEGMVWSTKKDDWVKASKRKAPILHGELTDYMTKVDGYSLRKVKNALRFAKSSFKIGVLQARLKKLGA